jgi:hypothetical protein
MLGLPGPTGKSHTVRLPTSKAGLETAIKILNERSQAQDLRLGKKGTPTQWEAENDQRYQALLKARKAEKELKAMSDAEADELLGDLGK